MRARVQSYVLNFLCMIASTLSALAPKVDIRSGCSTSTLQEVGRMAERSSAIYATSYNIVGGFVGRWQRSQLTPFLLGNTGGDSVRQIVQRALTMSVSSEEPIKFRPEHRVLRTSFVFEKGVLSESAKLLFAPK